MLFFKSVPVDSSLFQNRSITWFNPMISKYELFMFGKDVIGRKAKSISDEDIKNLCPTFTIDASQHPLNVEVLGSGGANVAYDMKLSENNTLIWTVRGQEDWQRSWVTKVGADYFVTVTCWTSGQKSWAVNTKVNKLDNAEKEDIYDHVKSIGFKDPKYFYEYNYENCEKAAKESYCMKMCLQN